MAASAYHTRSNSFPSRPHPLTSEFDEHLSRLRASESTTTSSSSICHKLNGLRDLHDCVDKLLQLTLSQKALAQEQHKKPLDELLDGSLRLLDVCSTTKDSLLQIKECAQELQSILRRRREFGLASDVKKYLTSRKAVKKAIHKALVNLKCMVNQRVQDKETEAMVNMLREVEAVTLTVLNSLLSFISGPKSTSKLNVWSFSKRMHNRRIACEEEETDINEMSKVDTALQALLGCKTKTSDNVRIENVQNKLQKMELCIQDFEDGLESLYRGLIKSRVAILNIQNH